MKFETLKCLIPVPQFVVPSGEKIFVDSIRTMSFAPEAADAAMELSKTFAYFKKQISVVSEDGNIEFICDFSLMSECWKIVLSAEKIHIFSADKKGFRYAVGALKQMLFAALNRGPRGAQLDCGTVEDQPRFGMRSFMLDSARHFQSAETVKRVLALLAEFRINSFHWHLADDQAWRIESAMTSEIAGDGEFDDGFYTKNEIIDIAEHAAKLGIEIIPEIDFPGHSKRVLSLHPELACDPAETCREFCIGNPESRKFLKMVLDEIMELFPNSPKLHLGGDEAETVHWEKCPVCAAALREKNLSDFRELENDFMKELAEYVISKGRIPVLWATCSGQKYPQAVIQQVWLGKLTELARIASEGHQMIFSIHNSLYFDYPADLSEPHESWMFELSECGVYMTEPYILWENELKDLLLGTEACLWTEYIPEWRIIPKLLPRIGAYAEVAWSHPENKDYHDFRRRADLLRASGYEEYLRTLR